MSSALTVVSLATLFFEFSIGMLALVVVWLGSVVTALLRASSDDARE